MSVVEYRDRFLTLSRYAPDETDTNEKRKERFLNGLHDEMQTVLVNIPFADLEALVDSAIQMEGKLHQANENKRRMMNQSGPHHTRSNNSSGGFTPETTATCSNYTIRVDAHVRWEPQVEARTTLPNLLYTLPRSCQTPASTFWCVTRAGTGTPRRARNVHAHARARTACVADAPGHVVAPPAPSLPLFSLCARRTTTTPATPWTRLPGRGNPVHHAMADAIRQGTRVHGDDADAPVLQFQRQDARRVHSDVANTAAPPPLTLTYRSHADVDDLPRSTRPPRAAIKGGIPWMISSHLSTPHSLLSPLDLLPLHIAARSRQISRRSPRRC
ncbi:hypothetical protein QYE76_001273 [Lolium multiflorum]|uniref:Retrotransposon gag domain-containing protein n=1 Tax=Lolium multiflorum TaxID=4521 RepID=A0AAD8VZ75_LOLMU|nr:hypothetical protein QYE76_001273 [Lolium multiflorum]